MKRPRGCNHRGRWRVLRVGRGGELNKVRGRASDHEDFLRATLGHADLLHTLALRLAPHPADAADIVQDTYLRAFAAWHRQRPDDVGAWLATICLNVGRDEWRRHARRSGLGAARGARSSTSRGRIRLTTVTLYELDRPAGITCARGVGWPTTRWVAILW